MSNTDSSRRPLFSHWTGWSFTCDFSLLRGHSVCSREFLSLKPIYTTPQTMSTPLIISFAFHTSSPSQKLVNACQNPLNKERQSFLLRIKERHFWIPSVRSWNFVSLGVFDFVNDFLSDVRFEIICRINSSAWVVIRNVLFRYVHHEDRNRRFQKLWTVSMSW